MITRYFPWSKHIFSIARNLFRDHQYYNGASASR